MSTTCSRGGTGRNQPLCAPLLKIEAMVSDGMSIGNLPLMSAWQVREYNLLISLVGGEFCQICRSPMHTPSGQAVFCVEYWYARLFQSISNLMQCNAATLSCQNRFPKKDSPPPAFFDYLFFLSSSSFQLFYFNFGDRLKGGNIPRVHCEGYHLPSDLTLHF